jgi:hypothetical protein
MIETKIEELKGLYERVIAEGKRVGSPAEPKAYFGSGGATIQDLEKKLAELRKEAERGTYILGEGDKVYIALYTSDCFGCRASGLEKYLAKEASAVSGKKVILLDSSGPGSDVGEALTELEQLKAADRLSEKALDLEEPWTSTCTDTLAMLMMRLKYTLGAKSVTYVSSVGTEPSKPVTI